MFDIFRSFFSSTRFSPILSYQGISLVILMILLVISVSVFNDIDYIHAQGSKVCDREIFSLVNCTGSLSNDGDYGEENIEQQIPLVIPFPWNRIEEALAIFHLMGSVFITIFDRKNWLRTNKLFLIRINSLSCEIFYSMY